MPVKYVCNVVWNTMTLQMICWRSKVLLGLLVLAKIFDLFGA